MDANPPLISGLPRRGRWVDIGVLCVLVTTCYLSLNWQFTGPTYLGDEIGYLSNAAYFAGSRIDGSSSYHFGYSLFLVPSFLLFTDTAAIWKAVLVTNALIFSVAFSVLYLIGESLCSNRSLRLLFVLLVAAYPAYPIMSGYAYSQPAFVLVFLLCCLTVMRFARTSYRGQLMLGGLVGFLYWVHPTALAVAVATALVGGIAAIADRRTLGPTIACLFIAGLMIVVYKLVLHPSVMDAMTPDGFAVKEHYPSIMNRLLVLLDPSGAVEFLTRFVGQISYFIISTLSIVTVGCFAMANRFAAGLKRGVLLDDNGALTLFVWLSFLLLLCMTATSFTKDHGAALNTWFYGRYAEGAFAPLLFFSLLHHMDRRANIVVSTSVIILFIILFSFSGFARTYLNLINVSAFWPALLPDIDGVPWWFSIGALGCAIAVLVPQPVRIVLLVVSFVACINAQIGWHHGSFRATSTPTGLKSFVRDNLALGSCIGIGSYPKDRYSYSARERFNLYSFYFHDYRYQRMTPQDWFDNCDGFYLTYQDAAKLSSLGAVQLGMEAQNGLSVYAKSWPQDTDDKSYGPYFIRRRPGDTESRLAFHMAAPDLTAHIGVGRRTDEGLRTIGKSGFLFYGPYILVEPGLLTFRVYGSAEFAGGAWIDIASGAGDTIHGKFPVRSTDVKEGLLAEGKIEFPSGARDMEIRLRVTDDSDIEFLRYELVLPK